ncbi:MAG: DUF1893 domain-containing protein [Lachnospiraceae bacterium]|nr:DUF1893 domain-containing protein [Lachnospiraceae bacterium]
MDESKELREAYDLMQKEGYSLVLKKEDDLITGHERGIRMLLMILQIGNDYSGYVAADKVIGKGAAFLYILLKIKEIHANVISEPALATLKDKGVKVFYEELVPMIRNRDNTGFCPMEQAVLDETDPQAAFRKLLEKTRSFHN